jgi:hypothetical protein
MSKKMSTVISNIDPNTYRAYKQATGPKRDTSPLLIIKKDRDMLSHCFVAKEIRFNWIKDPNNYQNFNIKGDMKKYKNKANSNWDGLIYVNKKNSIDKKLEIVKK